MGNKQLFITFIIAVFIHMVLISLYFYKNPNNEGSIDVGKNGLIVGVGISGSYVNNIKEGISEVESIKKESKAKVIEEIKKIEEKPKEITKIKPIEKKEEVIKPKKLEVKKEVIKIEEKTKKIEKTNLTLIEKPFVEPTLEKEEKEVSKNELEIKDKNESNEIETQTSKDSQLARKATGTGNEKHSGGKVGEKQGYLSIVKTKISRAKKYPRSARSEAVTGTAIVRFIIKLNGKVKNIKLIKSSGDGRLDKEAVKMLKRASPFPSIPKDVSSEPLDLTLPIEFSLKTIKNKFY